MRRAGDVQSGRMRPGGQLCLQSENMAGKEVFVFLWTGDAVQDGTSRLDRTLHERDACLGSRDPKKFPGVGIKDLAKESLKNVLQASGNAVCAPDILNISLTQGHLMTKKGL